MQSRVRVRVRALELGLGFFRVCSVIVISLTSSSIAKISALFLVLGLLRYGRECTRVKRCVHYVIHRCDYYCLHYAIHCCDWWNE